MAEREPVDDLEYRRQCLRWLRRGPGDDPFEAEIIEKLIEPVGFNAAIRRSPIRVLQFEGGQVLEFGHLGGEFLTRLRSPGALTSTWVLSEKNFVINEVRRVLNQSSAVLQAFQDAYDYTSYPPEGSSVEYFTADSIESGFESTSLEMVIVDDKFAWWISGINGTAERGWTNAHEIAKVLLRFRSQYSPR